MSLDGRRCGFAWRCRCCDFVLKTRLGRVDDHFPGSRSFAASVTFASIKLSRLVLTGDIDEHDGHVTPRIDG